MRGEQTIAYTAGGYVPGSPPLARGTAIKQGGKAPKGGITPACAGNSGKCRRTVRQRGDHPRLRGEQSVSASITPFRMGSPPLARGTASDYDKDFIYRGITPACAGNRWVMALRLPEREDHPRLRGEQLPAFAAVKHGAGSPPLARGTGVDVVKRHTQRGITPACAGNSIG